MKKINIEELKQLEGKTIKRISFPSKITYLNIRNDGSTYQSDYGDTNIEIETTDGVTVALSSWDYESYSSGIAVGLSDNKKV